METVNINRHLFSETGLHPPKLTSCQKINNKSIDNCYWKLIHNKLYDDELQQAYFQRIEAAAHTTKATLLLLLSAVTVLSDVGEHYSKRGSLLCHIEKLFPDMLFFFTLFWAIIFF